MPYSMDNPPKVAKNWTAEEQRKCISAANDVLAKKGSEQDAIFACINAAGKSKKEGRMSDLVDALKDFIRSILGEELERQGNKGWEGSASSYGSTEAYCAACAIDVSPPGEKKQSHCMLPYKKGGKPVKAGVVAAAQRFSQVKKPADVDAGKWSSAVAGARRKLASAYRQLVGDELPDSLKGGNRMISRTTIQRQDDGRYRAFSVSAVSVKNRVGELDSSALFDSFIAIASATGKYPQRDFMHLGRYGEDFVTGDIDFMARSDNVLITSTLYRDNELARAEIAARQAHADDWGDSIYYTQLSPGNVERDGDDPVWVSDFGFLQFVSTVPERLAASHFTSGTVQEVDRMSLQERDLEALAALFGDEEKARQWLESHVDNVEEAIKEAGMMARTVDDEPDADPEPETPEMVEFELDDAALDSIVERVISRLEDQFAQVMDKIVELQQQTTLLTDQAEKSRMLVDERLDALEADEEEKQKQWMADMPRKNKQRLLVTHRPSGNPTDPEEPTVAERAEVGLESWSVKERYPQ